MEQKQLLILLFVGILAYYIYSTNKINNIINLIKTNWFVIGLGLVMIYVLFKNKINEYFLNLRSDSRQFRMVLCNINDKSISEDKVIYVSNDTIINRISNINISVNPKLRQIVTGNDPIIAGLERDVLEQMIHCGMNNDYFNNNNQICYDTRQVFNCNEKYPSFVDRDNGKIRPFTLKLDPSLNYTYNLSLFNVDKDIIDDKLVQVNIPEIMNKQRDQLRNKNILQRIGAKKFNITNNFLDDTNNTIVARKLPINSIIMPVTNNSDDLLLGLFNIIRNENKILSIMLIKVFPVNKMLKLTFPEEVVKQAKEKEMEQQNAIQAGETQVSKQNIIARTNLQLLLDELGIKIEEIMYILPFVFTKVNPSSSEAPSPANS